MLFSFISDPNSLDRNLGMELVRVTEAAALAGGLWAGRGDKNGVDGAAVRAMRDTLDTVNLSGTVIIGEGEKDKAPCWPMAKKLVMAKAPKLMLP